MGRVKFKDFDMDEAASGKYSKRNHKHESYDSDYEEVNELVEEFKSRKQEELRKHHRQIRDKYYHEDV